MIAESTQSLGKIDTLRCHHPTLTGGEMFDWEETEHRHVREAARTPSLVLGTQSVRSIFYDDEATPLGQVKDGVQVGRMSRVVHRKNDARLGCDASSYLLWIEVERIGANICEDRSRALIQNAICGRRKRHGGCDGFIPGLQAGGKGRAVQGSGARTERDGIFRANTDRKCFLEFVDLRASGQPVGMQNICDSLNVAFID